MIKLAHIGALRLSLLGLTLLCYPLVWFSELEPVGIGLLTSYIAPAVVVMLFFVLLLDALMNRVFMIDLQGEARALRRSRMWLALAAVGGILLFWGPYFQSIGEL